MMTKKKFVKMIDFFNQLSSEEEFVYDLDETRYCLKQISSSEWHDGKQANIFQLAFKGDFGNEPEWEYCNFYALEYKDAIEKSVYSHALIPMTKVVTYTPEEIIPEKIRETYSFI